MTPIFRKAQLSLVLAAVLTATLPVAHASGGGAAFDGATLPEQIVQEATLVDQLARQAEMVAQGYQSLINQAKNLQSLVQNPVPNLDALLNNLISIAAQSSQLTYAGQNISAQFQKLYPDYKPGVDYGQQYANWRNTVQTNLQNELTAAGLQANNFASETQALNSALQLSQSAVGRLQAIQAGNQISAMLVQQLQQLRQLVMNQQQSQAAYMMMQQKAEQNSNNQANQAMQLFVGKNGSNGIPSAGSFQMGSPFPNLHR
jgi:P-type conjugative transfer protein TrbJ